MVCGRVVLIKPVSLYESEGERGKERGSSRVCVCVCVRACVAMSLRGSPPNRPSAPTAPSLPSHGGGPRLEAVLRASRKTTALGGRFVSGPVPPTVTISDAYDKLADEKNGETISEFEERMRETYETEVPSEIKKMQSFERWLTNKVVIYEQLSSSGE